MTIRVGIGYDLHRLEGGGDHLMLGGVRVPFHGGAVAHSDGDVVIHALIDAMLGAAGLGNIGQRFPDSDPNLRGVDSMALLERTIRLLHSSGFTVVNADMVVVLERPRLAPHLDAMRQRIAECLKIERHRVSVKPKINEGVGPEGRGEAVSAQAVVLVQQQ